MGWCVRFGITEKKKKKTIKFWAKTKTSIIMIYWHLDSQIKSHCRQMNKNNNNNNNKMDQVFCSYFAQIAGHRCRASVAIKKKQSGVLFFVLCILFIVISYSDERIKVERQTKTTHHNNNNNEQKCQNPANSFVYSVLCIFHPCKANREYDFYFL